MKIRIVMTLICLLSISFFSFKNRNASNYKSISDKNTFVKNQNNGEALYEELCIQCHLGTGKATAGIIPPLDGSDWLTKKRKESIHAVKYGLKGPITVNGKNYNGNMPAMGLNDQEVTDLMNYIMTAWSNIQKKPVTVEEVAAVKK